MLNPLVIALGPLSGLLGPLLLLVIVVVILTLVPTVSAAVWSSRSARRCAAASVLDRMLTTIERLMTPARSSA